MSAFLYVLSAPVAVLLTDTGLAHANCVTRQYPCSPPRTARRACVEAAWEWPTRRGVRSTSQQQEVGFAFYSVLIFVPLTFAC